MCVDSLGKFCNAIKILPEQEMELTDQAYRNCHSTFDTLGQKKNSTRKVRILNPDWTVGVHNLCFRLRGAMKRSAPSYSVQE
eukprot:1298517-Rhodomonas_salina.1